MIFYRNEIQKMTGKVSPAKAACQVGLGWISGSAPALAHTRGLHVLELLLTAQRGSSTSLLQVTEVAAAPGPAVSSPGAAGLSAPATAAGAARGGLQHATGATGPALGWLRDCVPLTALSVSHRCPPCAPQDPLEQFGISEEARFQLGTRKPESPGLG